MYVHKGIRGKECRFMMVKGILDQTMVTLVNIYGPESDKDNSQILIWLYCWRKIKVYGGDLTAKMDYGLDTTSYKRPKKPLTKLVKNTREETGIFDVWRDLHPLQRD